ncbi:MAG TPA: M56 family metallopeptidase, partial [Pirellulales bacterium]|nr:M56 family metallopeptidase [Pirellulales bacterium]
MTWLVAIGLTNAASASLLAVVAWTVGRWGRRPALARLLWLVVLAKLLTPPVYEPALGGWFSIPLHETPAEWERSQAARADFAVRRADMPRAAIPLEDSRAAEKTLQRTSAAPSSFTAAERWHLWQMLAAVRPATWLRLAGSIWIMGSLVCATRFVLRTWRFRRFLARAAQVDADLTQRAAQLAQSAGLRSSPQVLAVESVVSPMLWGAGRGARLLFPAELASSIPPATRDALLLHELAHWARGDWLVRLLELVVQVIYWWHPLVRWARREIEIAEEECCDAWVLEHQAGTRRGYAEALLATLDFLSGPIPSL